MDFEKRHSIDSPLSKTPSEIEDGGPRDVEKELAELRDGGSPGIENEQGEDLERSKSTKSIAETLSLPREIAFVSIICMAQFMTRWSLLSLFPMLLSSESQN
jgi:hypothetical protein